MHGTRSHPKETFLLGPFTVPRVWVGLWQLSSNAWGSASAVKVRQAMARHAELGYNSFDMADHYGSAEILFGQFKESSPKGADIVGATKWCVFRQTEASRSVVEAAVQERMACMRTTTIDLLQFHWQDYSDKGYLTALQILQDFQNKGIIKAVGLCNFDVKRTDEICTQLGPGFIVSNQVQFSLIDTRPLHGMTDVCEQHNLKLLTYGTLCGGFLADKWLGQPEPDLYSGALTPSQRKVRIYPPRRVAVHNLTTTCKYLDMILKAWGNWALFQDLLVVLRGIGDRHGGLSIANIAMRWVLDQPSVGAVIIGVRLGVSEHTDDNDRVFGFKLNKEDNRDIEAVQALSKGHQMITTIGDCGAEYR